MWNIKAILWISRILSKGSGCLFETLKEKEYVRFANSKRKVFWKRLNNQTVKDCQNLGEERQILLKLGCPCSR